MNPEMSDKSRFDQAKNLEARVWKSQGQNNIAQAITECRQLNWQYPEFASGWHTASQLALKINDPAAALQAIEEALIFEPDHTPWRLHKALCLARLGRMEELGSLVGQLSARQMQTAYQCSTLAMLLTQLELREQAVALYRKSIKLQPEQSQHYYNVAVLQRSLGDIEAAERNFDQAINLNPVDYEAYKIRSEIRTQTPDNNHVAALEQVLESGIDDQRGEVNICYALAKELEDLGAAERSFNYLKRGADTRRGYMQYDVQRDLETISAIQKSYQAELFESDMEGDDNSEAIFILGLPRTGTTLVERILSSHSDVRSAGELNNFAVQMMRQVKSGAADRKISRDQLVALTTALDFRKLGQAYISSTRPFTGHSARFIDKLPLNYLYAGLIHLALPNAKIINLKRHPLDTCYAIYKQLFVDAYPFSYDLEELGQYFVAYQQLIDHWQQVMPGVIHTVVYEQLVAEVERESRRLLEFCRLEWQPQCLKFYASKDASTTASTVQVRKPVYTSSVGKWRQHETRLAPLIAVLEQAGIPLD